MNFKLLLRGLRSRTAEEMLMELETLRAAFDEATAGIRDQIEKLEERLELSFPKLQAKIGELEQSIKDETLTRGETIVGDGLQCVYSAGKASWDTKRLEGYATDRPDILQFRKIGEPSAYIKPKK